MKLIKLRSGDYVDPNSIVAISKCKYKGYPEVKIHLSGGHSVRLINISLEKVLEEINSESDQDLVSKAQVENARLKEEIESLESSLHFYQTQNADLAKDNNILLERIKEAEALADKYNLALAELNARRVL